jgi:tetratricopeptide (TPR) repeat protein
MAETNRRLPRYVALGALLVYVLTLSRSITLQSLPLTAQLTGWDWLPMAGQPLLWLFTLPLRLLPAVWIPAGLNLFSAVCGALTLGLLARSVQLLPQDRTPIQRVFLNKDKGLFTQPDNWAPGVLACVVCGLEFGFWQEATAATGEMLDMLLLAAAIWCLLEYRAGRESRWLNTAALIWGLGLAENWVMLLTLPLFAASLLWLRRRHFLRGRYLPRMGLLMLAGFSIYALLPLVNGLAPRSPWGFGEAWHMTLRTTKHTILLLYGQFWTGHRYMGVVVLLFYLLPILPCLIRLPDEGGYLKALIARLHILVCHVSYAFLLLVCLWLAFDPAIGLQQIMLRQLGYSMPLLSFDYVTALGAGYFAGYFMLVFGAKLREQYRKNPQFKKPPFTPRWLRHSVPPFLCALPVLVAGGLIFKNAPAVTLVNRQPLQSFGDLAVRSLPAGGGIVLSDDPQKLFVFQAALARYVDRYQWLPVDTRSLPDPEYRAQLERKCPVGWLTGTNRNKLKPPEMLLLLDHVARTNRLFYLHPSFGYFFERFYLQPHEAVYEMKPYPKDQFNGPPMSVSEADQNEKFWDVAWQTELEFVTQTNFQRQSTPSKAKKMAQKIFLQYLYLSAIPSLQSRLLGEWSSITLNGWGVELQRNGRLPEARQRFEQAIALNTNNLAALVNLQCNTNLQAGNKMNLLSVDTVASQLGKLQRLSPIMNHCGPFDDPVFCFLLGDVYQQIGLLHQAMQEFERAQRLAPNMLSAKFALAQLYSRQRMDDKVFETVNLLRDEIQTSAIRDTMDVDLSVLEANSWLSQTNPARARSVLQSVLKEHPNDKRTLNLVLQEYLVFGDFTNALQLVSGKLAQEPDNVAALVNQAAILMQMGDATNAIPILNYALAITNLPIARLNRAGAYLQTQNLPAAEADYFELENSPAQTFPVHYGLAEIAERRHDTNLAIHHLELCLSNAPAGTVKWREVRERLDRLEPPVRKH